MERREIIIIGAGPAGISTALSLQRLAPELGEAALVLEKASHPRHKLCGGGLTPYAEETLSFLDVTVSVPAVPIHKVRLHLGKTTAHFKKANMMRIVRREEFDAELARQARARGVEIREEQRVVELIECSDGIEVRTQGESYWTRILVGADGANSLVRKKLLSEGPARLSRLVEALVKVNPEETPEFLENMAVLDFRPTRDHLQGYVWDFPSYVDGEAYLNLGVFDSQIHADRRADLRQLLTAEVEQRGLQPEKVKFMGHPERWFASDGRYAGPHVLLVGDAAGIEPWFGEGISIALAYGPVAAKAIKQAYDNKDFSFGHYRRLILKSRLGKFLERNRLIAKYFYTRKMQRLMPLIAKAWETYFNARVKDN